MKGVKSITSYKNPEAVGYTECIETAAGKYFVAADTGEIQGPFAEDIMDEIEKPYPGDGEPE